MIVVAAFVGKSTQARRVVYMYPNLSFGTYSSPKQGWLYARSYDFRIV